jgi:hypothetical protein
MMNLGQSGDEMGGLVALVEYARQEGSGGAACLVVMLL